MYLLGKVFTFIFNPLLCGLILLACVVLGALLRRSWRTAATSGFVLVWFWAWSTPWLYSRLGGGLEAPYPPYLVESYPAGDYIVLLGGGVAPHPRSPYPELFSAADRVWQSARLYHAGKAPKIVVSGSAEKETSYVLLKDLGVPPGSIIVENEARNTDENAKRVKEIMDKEKKGGRILLVTSAWHMRRAEYLFRQAGLSVIPVATDYEGLYFKAGVERSLVGSFLPAPDMLARNSLMVKEYLGYWIYLARDRRKR